MSSGRTAGSMACTGGLEVLHVSNTLSPQITVFSLEWAQDGSLLFASCDNGLIMAFSIAGNRLQMVERCVL